MSACLFSPCCYPDKKSSSTDSIESKSLLEPTGHKTNRVCSIDDDDDDDDDEILNE